ncbi:carbonic anhydrase [Dongia sp.]|uniref:carbonic anhydrase n=1 Tax=Dongia sp. TaxID=1977262 RepID=UPI0035B0355B
MSLGLAVAGIGTGLGTGIPGWPGAAARAEEAALHTAPHWDYTGPKGAENWRHLSPDYAACGGTRQSPIDLGGALPVRDDALELHWIPFAADLTHNGHTLQAAPRDKDAGYLTLDGKRFDFRQFHFHHPSEHAFAGKRWPLEVHAVHQAADGNLAVIGILFRPGRENDVLANIIGTMPRHGETRPIPKPIDLSQMLPRNAAAFAYAGSLTTPPCSEIVSWIVFRDPVEAGIGQIESFAREFPMNARPLQPSAGRPVNIDLF